MPGAPPVEDAGRFIEIGRFDWFVTPGGHRLHAVLTFTAAHRAEIARDWQVRSAVQLACGRTASGAWIPGMFTRAGALRCAGCCRATGLPPGRGSPKNDPACRALLGLP